MPSGNDLSWCCFTRVQAAALLAGQSNVNINSDNPKTPWDVFYNNCMNDPALYGCTASDIAKMKADAAQAQSNSAKRDSDCDAYCRKYGNKDAEEGSASKAVYDLCYKACQLANASDMAGISGVVAQDQANSWNHCANCKITTGIAGIPTGLNVEACIKCVGVYLLLGSLAIIGVWMFLSD
jgi:hypothetical protein